MSDRRVQRERQIALLAAGICIAAVSAAAVLTFGQRQFPKRFATVVDGRLYRSGSVTPGQLERLSRQKGIRTVLSLLDPAAPESVAEKEAAEQLGLRWCNVPLRGNGDSTPAERELIKAVLFDPGNAPLLVHCAAGTNRTGLAIGMYRLREQGWALEQVMEEMYAFDFEDEPHHENLRAALAREAAAANAE
jgi:protein tyrosine/serine phosphatase